jgi:hypothetical protein
MLNFDAQNILYPQRFAMLLGRSRITVGVALQAALITVFALAFGPIDARAQDLFTVSGVAVDKTAKTVRAARDRAIAEGQTVALRQMFERITLKSDHGYLPQPTGPELATLVQSFEVADEKTSATRYLAKLTVHFNKDAVRQLLRNSGIGFTETLAKPILVLPVYEFAATRVLWEEPNPWMMAWRRSEAPGALAPLISPLGDLTDVAAINAEQALSGDTERLEAVTERYQLSDVLVAHAKLTLAVGTGIPRLAVTIQQYGPSGDRTLIETYTGTAGGKTDALLDHAVASIRDKFEEGWKRETLIKFGSEDRLSVNVPLNGLGDWLAIRNRLETVAEIKKIDIASITYQDAQLLLHYLGDPDRLKVTLAQKDLDLVEEGGFWLLKLRQGAGPQSSVPDQTQ